MARLRYPVIMILAAAFMLISILPASGQFLFDPAWNWRSVETEHFRIHYPVNLEFWTLRTVSKMEAIHREVTVLVGYGIERKVDVLVMDPAGQPNGMAMPFLDFPRIILWATSPDPEMLFGGLSDWGELVFAHEDVHIVHLSRRARNAMEKIVSFLLPIGPLALKSPLWLVEGFAVLNESELTGRGRCRSSLRAMFLRQLALEGKLPEYSGLNGGDPWTGRRIPYLVGSAFLEWLKTESGNPDACLHLFKRMSARQKRSFVEAFSGLFEGMPEDLYDRFKAETIAEAFKIEQSVETVGRIEGDKWADFEGMTGRPAVSLDGSKLAVIRRDPPKPLRLEILSTSETDPKKKEKKKAPDPEDIPDKMWKPPERKQIAEFTARNGIYPNDPRWFPDNRSIVFDAAAVGPDSMFHYDLYRWNIDTGNLERLTRSEDLHSADVSPDGSWLAAVRRRSGMSSLVRLDLRTRRVSELIEPAPDISWGAPRISPDGRKLAAACWGRGFSEIRILDLDTGAGSRISGFERDILAFPAWTGGNGLVYSTDNTGIYNLEYYDCENNLKRQLTLTTSGIFSPEPDPGHPGNLYYIAPDSKGFDIYYFSPGDSAVPDLHLNGFCPVMPPMDPVEIPIYETQEISPGLPYRLGPRPEFAFAFSGGLTPSGDSIELGMNGGDVLGRLGYSLMAAYGYSGGTTGGSMEASLKRWPIGFSADLFWTRSEPSEQDDYHRVTPLLADRKTYGISLGSDWSRIFRLGSFAANARVLTERIRPESGTDDISKSLIGLSFDTVSRFSYGHAGFSAALKGDYLSGMTDGEYWSQARLTGRTALRYRHFMFTAQAGKGKTYGDFSPTDVFHLGGWISSVESPMDLHGRIPVAYLPAGILIGRNFEQLRLELAPDAGIPFMLFAECARVWCNTAKPDPIRAIGLELNGEIPPISLLKIPSTSVRAGFAYILDEPYENKWKGYIAVSIRP